MDAETKQVIVDLTAMLAHFVEGKSNNWDGSTQGQARAAIREARALIAKEKGTEQ